jgi:hypothetical protein
VALPWIKVAVELPQHPKLDALEQELGVCPGLGLAMVVRLWCWTAKYHPVGTVPRRSWEAMEREIAAGMEALSTGESLRNGVVVTALVTAGLAELREAGNALVLHDWEDFNTAHSDKARQNRERQRRFRERHASRNTLTNGDVTRDVTPLDEMRGDENREEPPKAPREEHGGQAGLNPPRIPKRFRPGTTTLAEDKRIERDKTRDQRSRMLDSWIAEHSQPLFDETLKRDIPRPAPGRDEQLAWLIGEKGLSEFDAVDVVELVEQARRVAR